MIGLIQEANRDWIWKLKNRTGIPDLEFNVNRGFILWAKTTRVQ